MEAIVLILALDLVTGEVTKCEFSEASLAEAIDNEAVGVKRVTRDKRDMYEGNYRGRGDMYEGNYRGRGEWRNWELSVDDKSRVGRRISPRELAEMPRLFPAHVMGRA